MQQVRTQKLQNAQAYNAKTYLCNLAKPSFSTANIFCGLGGRSLVKIACSAQNVFLFWASVKA